MDEQTNALAHALKDHMDREAELFYGLQRDVERLRASLQEKDWNAGLAIAQGMERSAQSIEEADIARDRSFALLRTAMDLPRETAFSALLPALPDGLRESLEESWRQLRMSVIRLKTATGRLRYSAEAMADTLNRILERIFPYRKGKIYSRKGTATRVAGAHLVDRKL
jgi:hypothetical protein